jgi:hypothetical protein
MNMRPDARANEQNPWFPNVAQRQVALPGNSDKDGARAQTAAGKKENGT